MSDIKLALICLMIVVGFGAVFIVVLPMIMVSAMLGGAAAASKSSEDTQ